MTLEDRINRVRAFRNALQEYEARRTPELRTYLNENLRAVRSEVMEAGCMKSFTIAPPAMIGGMIMKNIDPFTLIHDAPYGQSMIDPLTDILDETVGVLRDPAYQEKILTKAAENAEVIEQPTEKGLVFIAMPMAGGNVEYDDVRDAIVRAAANCGLHAERVDDVQSNERITDRLLESIRKAEFVVVDLTDSRPNVFYEAGYAQGLGKTPIYVAKEGTKPEFDIKDFPIIFFASLRSLQEGLEKRMRALTAKSS